MYSGVKDLKDIDISLLSSDETRRKEALRFLPSFLLDTDSTPSISTLSHLVNIVEKMHRIPLTKSLEVSSSTIKFCGPKLDASAVLLLVLDSAELYLSSNTSKSQLDTVAYETFLHLLIYGNGDVTLTLPSCYWNVVHGGLRLPTANKGVRKLATSLLIRGLSYIKKYEESSTHTTCSSAVVSWDAFVLILEALEDFPAHLLEELWEAKSDSLVTLNSEGIIDIFIEKCQSPVYAESIPTPTFNKPMSFIWASVIFDRAYSHENPSVRRTFLTNTFTSAVLSAGDGRGPATTASLTALPGGTIPSTVDSQASISAGLLPFGNYTSSSVPEENEQDAGSTIGPIRGSYVNGGESRKASAASATSLAATDVLVSLLTDNQSSQKQRSIGLAFPTWYVASTCGSHLLTHLNDSALFTGALETTGRELHDFILSYGAILFETYKDKNGIFSSWVKSLIDGLHACLICKGAVKWILRALSLITNHIQFRHSKRNESNKENSNCIVPRILNEQSLASLRMIYSGITLLNTRNFSRNVAISIIKIITTLCDPMVIPIADLAMTLSLFPASLVFIQDDTRLKLEHWLLQSGNCNKLVDQELNSLQERLRDSIDAYINSKQTHNSSDILTSSSSSSPRLMLSAAGLARVSTLMFNRTGDPSLPKTVSLVFYSLINALSSLQSRSYLDPKLRARSILLAEALIFAGLPTGGRGDSHLSFALNGGALPLSPTEIQVPLFAEWSATSRYAASSYSHIYSRVPLQDSLENPAVPFEDEKDHESSIERRYTSLPVLAAAVLCQNVVSEEFSAALESVISDGLNLSSTISSVSSRSIWCPRHGILEKGKEPTSRNFDTVAPYPPAPLPFFTALCILRDLSNISGEGSHFYRASSERLVNSAFSLLRSIPKMAETSVARFVEITNALHTLAPLSPSLKSDTISLNDVIKTCLSIISIKPKGASEPALPVSLGAAPSSTLSTTVDIDDKQWRSFFVEFPSMACPACSFSFISDKRIPGDEDSRNSSSDKVVSWMSLRSSLETSRWLSIASCLSLVDSPLHIRARNLKTKQSLLASLSLEIAEELAIASMDALSFCNDGTSGVAALFVSGLVLRALPLKDEDHKDLIIANKIFGTSGTGEMAPLNNCVDFLEILTAIERMMILPKTSRRLAEAYASCIANPELFLRPALHVSTSGESYGPFLKHLFVIVEAFSGESANHHLLQCLTSKLCIAWTALFQVLEDNHSTEVVSVCRIVLRSHIPLMMRLLLHREFFSLHEEPALCDATARAQMREWIKFHRGNDEAEQFDKVKVSLRPQGIAGALVRIQVLCWLEKILMTRKTINRQTMLLIIRDLALLLLALNLTPEFLVESIPGSSVHSIKLRSWQALSLIAREWGRFGSDIVTTNTYSTTADVFLIDSTSYISVRIARAEALLPSSPTEARRLCSRFLALAAPPVPHNAFKMKAMKSVTYVSAGNSNDGGEFIKIKSNFLDIFTTDDLADLALAFQLVIFKYQLSLTQQPSTRQYLEACSAAISRRFPATSLHGILLPLLSTGYAKTQLAFSLMLVCADLAHSLAIRATTLEKEETSTTVLLASLSSQVILATFPWTSSPMGLVRVVALSSLVRTVSVLFPEIDSSNNRVNALIPSLPGLDEWVRPLIRLSLHSPDLGDMIQRQDKHFLRLHPETSLSLESLLTSRCTEHGELISEDAYSYIRATFQRLTVELHVRDPANIVDDDFLDARADAAMKAGLIPTCSIIDQKYCLGFGNLTLHGPFGSDDSVSSLQSFQQAPEEAMNLQRKIHSQMALSAEAKDKIKGAHSLPSVSNDDTLRPHAATLALRERQHPLLTFAAEPPLSGQEGSIEVADGRKYQPAIVLASLVTKIPNLGGLARTCEVLGIQSLVVHDIRIRSDQEFKSISVSAADWLPIYGCRVENMLSYVRARRRQGYTIVGLEQAARSVRLGSSACVLPDQCVFVLGAEKEGIPVTLLQELDIVVEIPQLGLTRSMNVHVSASLLLWEYTRQRMKRAGFE